MKLFSLSLLCILSFSLTAQKNKPVNRIQSFQKLMSEQHENLLKGISFTNIGPTIMGGRVVDLEVDPADPTHFYVAYASGGLWETVNNGTSFTPVFEHEAVITIGDIAVDWKNKRIWVGTGENNSSRSSYAGEGIYRSDDNGKTWKHSGLNETQHISRIIIHPANPEIVHVAAIGHLFTFNKERGMFKTTDGGKTWKQTLFINDKTGVIDVDYNRQNPDILYASAWQRERKGWNFTEAGPGSGIYKSTDGGESWKLISTPQSNFPQGEGVGRIGIAVAPSNGNTLYAFLDNQTHRPKTPETGNRLTKDKLRTMTKEEFLQLNTDLIEAYLRENDFPERYKAKAIVKKISKDEIKPSALVEYLEDANSLLFDTPVTGAEVYRSNDGGQTWIKTHEGYLDGLVYTYGYYFGQVRIHEKNPEKFYIAAFYVIKSEDGGKTFSNINGDNQHVDHHGLWINPDREGHLINGNDGGINITYDDGKNWIKCINTATGQFYTVNVDMATPYNVYGGLQDNGVWTAASTYTQNNEWQNSGQYPYKMLLGGDGMQVAVDTRDNNTIYTGYQFGHYYRINKSTGDATYITPKHELGERPFRFNWQAPVHLSVHNQDVIYLAGNKVFRSMKKGDDFKAISPDLTTGGKKGDVAFGTITTIHESPLKFGLLYAGTDDGLVHVSRDGGNNWTNITNGLPQGYWVRRVQASAHKEGRVYVCLNGHTEDDFNAWVYISDDFGKTWKQIGKNLPAYSVNVVREDPENEKIIYLGNDLGVFISLDRGENFFLASNGMPTVAVHDLVIQNRDKEMVVGTHGRSLYKANIKELQLLNDTTLSKPVYVFAVDRVKFRKSWGAASSIWEKPFEPSMKIYYWAGKDQTPKKLRIKTAEGVVVHEVNLGNVIGLNEYAYDFTIDENKSGNYLEAMKSAKTEITEFPKTTNGKKYLFEHNYIIEVISGNNVSATVLEPAKKD